MPDSDTEMPVRSVSRPRSSAPFFPRILEMILAAGRGMLEGRWEAGTLRFFLKRCCRRRTDIAKTRRSKR